MLLVEDNPVNQEIVRAVLEAADLTVILAENGREAVAALQERDVDVDVVLMDIQMPVMDGYAATAEIRKLGTDVRNIPIIAMTAHAMKGDEDKCLKAGMDGYISKPITQDRLFRTMWRFTRDRKRTAPYVQPARQQVPTLAPDAAALPDMLPGIDIRSALAALNIPQPVFRRILAGFRKNNLDRAAGMIAAFNGQGWDTLRRMAHSLKGSAGNIGAVELQDAARALERGCEDGTTSPPGRELLRRVEAALEQVLESIRTL